LEGGSNSRITSQKLQNIMSLISIFLSILFKVEHKRMAIIRAWYDATIDAHWDPIIRALINMNKHKIASNVAKEFCGNHDLSHFKNE